MNAQHQCKVQAHPITPSPGAKCRESAACKVQSVTGAAYNAAQRVKWGMGHAVCSYACILLFLFAFHLSLFKSAFAGTSGKITGQVTDQNGNPLPGANVKIEGTKRGAEADIEGVYLLLSVEPGHHTLVAQMIGYEPQRKTDVRVTSDFTTNESFALKEKALQGEEIVVQAQRGEGQWGMFSVKSIAPAVEVDKTTSMAVVRGDDITALTIVRDITDFIELQAGVSIDDTGEEISIRASAEEDMGYYLDGVRIPVKDHVEAKAYRNINRLAVQEMTVVTGGMDAEYGNAQGGIINVVMREGRTEYDGLVDYQFTPPGKKHWGANVYDANIHRGRNRWDDPEWVAETVTLPDGREVPAHQRVDYTGISGHFVEGIASGPLLREWSFFATGKWQRKASAFPGLHLSTPFNINTLFKLNYEPLQNVKLHVGGLYDRRQAAFDPDQILRFPTTSRGMSIGIGRGVKNGGQNLFLTNSNPAGDFFDTDYLLYAGLTHLLSEQTFYEVRMSHSVSKRDTADVRLPNGMLHISETLSSSPVMDRENHYAVYREMVAWERFRRARLSFKADLASQIHSKHFVKIGLELTRYNNWYQAYLSESPQRRMVGWYGKTYRDTEFFPGQKNRGVTPVQLGVYVQDKIELEGMVVNAGLRYDTFYQNTRVPDVEAYYGSPMWNSMTRNQNVPTIDGRRLASLTHRIGISHPLTTQSVIHYFYGRFTQFPNFGHMYRTVWESVSPTAEASTDRDLNGNGQIDAAERWNAVGGFEAFPLLPHPNAHMHPEESTSIEVGIDWNLVSDYVVGLTTYYRSANNQIAGFAQGWVDLDRPWRVPVQPVYAILFERGGFRDTRGIELNLKKRFSRLFAFNFALNLQWADESQSGTGRSAAFPDSLFVANGHFWTTYDTDPATGAEIPVSLKEMAIREGRAEDFYIKLYGSRANQTLRTQMEVTSAAEGSGWRFVPDRSHIASDEIEGIPGSFTEQKNTAYWQQVADLPGYPGRGEGNLLVFHEKRGTERTSVATRDRRAFGSLAFLFAMPPVFGPWQGKALGNVRANLVYRFYTGTPIPYSQVVYDPRTTGERRALPSVFRQGPMHTRVDLNVEKGWGNPAGFRLVLAVEIFNLFNQKDVRSVAPGSQVSSSDIDFDANRWVQWGIVGLEPNSADFKQFGEVNEINNYWGQPREMTFGIRLQW